MWTNKVNGKRYIGKCHVDVDKRRRDHLRGQGSRLLKQAFDKYGVENFAFEILHDGILDIFLDDYEIQTIKKYNTVSPNGYNLTYGGEGGKPSEETRRKISEFQKGKKRKPPSQVTRLKISKANKGRKSKPFTADHRRKLSEANKRRVYKPHSVESRAKMSEAQRGKKHSMQTRRKISEGNKGKKMSSESIKKIREAQKGRTVSPETRRKISETQKGRKRNPEAVKKTADAIRGVPKNPLRDDAKAFYLSLPSDMTAFEKRSQLRQRFPTLSKSTVHYWTKQWQSETD